MILVRAIAALLVVFLIYAAFRTPEDPLVPLVAAAFFTSMLYLSLRNAGKIDSPYIFVAGGAVSFAYSLIGVVTGQYTWKRYTVRAEQDPEVYWSILLVTLLFSLGLFSYGYLRLQKKRHA